MPKNEIDYSNTIIYKITCKDTNIKDVYVGHTTNFVQRKHAHKQTCINSNSDNYKCKLYSTIRANGGWQNWTMEIINFYNCKDHYEARKKEQEYFILLGATLNSIEPLPKPKVIISKDKVISPVKEETYLCDFKCSNSNELETHNVSDKHLKRISDEKNNLNTNNPHSKNDKTFECKVCQFTTSKASNYNIHLTTVKHKRLTNPTKIMQETTPKTHLCACGKKYKHASSLCAHKKICDNADNADNNFKTITNIVTELVKSNAELQKQVIELCMNINTNISN